MANSDHYAASARNKGNHHEADAGAALLTISNLTIGFRQKNDVGVVPALHNLSLTLHENETLALVGESGSGKSVTALAIMGLLANSSVVDPASRVLFEGIDMLNGKPAERRALYGKDVAMIFQDPMSSLNPVLTVGYQICETLRLHLNMSRSQARSRAISLLQEVGITEPERRIDSYPNQLSGGQQQRVMIAIAIACEPRLLIADEPTTALDVTIQKQILELLAQLRTRRRMAMLFITHDLALVHQIAENVIVLRKGETREAGPTRTLFSDPQDAYTRALLACRPSATHKVARLPVVQDFMNDPSGPVSRTAVQAAPASVSQDTDAPLLVVENLSKYYYRRGGLFRQIPIPAVEDISFTLHKGKTLGIVGESGSGKSTLGLTIVKLHQARAGRVLYRGTDIIGMNEKTFRPLRKKIQIVFQNPYASLNPRMTIQETMMEPLIIHGTGSSPDERMHIVEALLDRVDISRASLLRYPHEFSGGQRQRIAIARCLTMQPEILICDESVSALDVSVQAQVLNLLKDLQEEFGLSYLFISHDLAVIRHLADDVLVMKDGRAVELASADQLYLSPQQAYTRSLLAAVPSFN